eukprot:SAG22_NODE_3657_length_1590_cov_1.606304_2_plen_197_part_00
MLCQGNVEFVAPAEYMVRPPQPPVYFFVIDVSYNAVTSGLLQSAVNSILRCLESLDGEHTGGRTKVGFLTFDSTLHFYNLKSTLSRPQMLVVSDVVQVFTPSNDGLLVDLADSAEVKGWPLTTLPFCRVTAAFLPCFHCRLLIDLRQRLPLRLPVLRGSFVLNRWSRRWSSPCPRCSRRPRTPSPASARRCRALTW